MPPTLPFDPHLEPNRSVWIHYLAVGAPTFGHRILGIRSGFCSAHGEREARPLRHLRRRHTDADSTSASSRRTARADRRGRAAAVAERARKRSEALARASDPERDAPREGGNVGGYNYFWLGPRPGIVQARREVAHIHPHRSSQRTFSSLNRRRRTASSSKAPSLGAQQQ